MSSTFPGEGAQAPTPPPLNSWLLCPLSWNRGFRETPTHTLPISVGLPSHCSHPNRTPTRVMTCWPHTCHSAASTGAPALRRLGLPGRLSQLPLTGTVPLLSTRSLPLSPAPPALCPVCSPSHARPGAPSPRAEWEWGKFEAGARGLRGPRGRLQPRDGWRRRGRSGPGAGPTARSVPPHAPPRGIQKGSEGGDGNKYL